MMMMTTKKTLKRHHSFSISSVSLKTGILIPVILIFLQMTTGVVGVRIKELKVPQPGVIGRPATLECDWDMEHFGFYSIRWYKNDEQVYSFVKGNLQEKIDHGLVDVKVDLDLSDDHKVTISEVTAASEGQYTCSVMSEPPFFTSDSLQKKFIVVKMPDKPEIIGLEPSYMEGELLNVTCIARHAYPPASIRFLMNDEPVVPRSESVKDIDVSLEDVRFHHPKGSYTTSGQIAVHLSQNDVGDFQLTCVASVESPDRSGRVEVKTLSSTNVEPSGGANILPVSLLIGLMVYISLITQSLC